MAGPTQVTVIGRSLHDIAAIWGSLHSFYGSADLIVSESPVERALEGPGRGNGAMFVVLDRSCDFDSLRELEEVPEWLFLLCSTEELQRMQPGFDTGGVAGLPMLPMNDLHLSLLGRQLFRMLPHDRTPHTGRL